MQKNNHHLPQQIKERGYLGNLRKMISGNEQSARADEVMHK